MGLKTQIHLTLYRALHEAGEACFEVTKVVNLTTPLPGDMIKQADVDNLLAADRKDRRKNLTITITPKK